MELGLPKLNRIAQLGDSQMAGTLELARLMEDTAKQLGISTLAEAVEQFDNQVQAGKMLVSVAAFNLGVAVRPKFGVQLEKVIEPGGYFGIGDITSEREAILTRQGSPHSHLAIAVSVLNSLRSIS